MEKIQENSNFEQECDLEIYRQKYEQFRHLDRLRWQAPGITFASGTVLVALFGESTWIHPSILLFVFGVISLLSAFMILRIRKGIGFNREVLQRVAKRIGDTDIPPMSGKWGATSAFGYLLFSIGVMAIGRAICILR